MSEIPNREPAFFAIGDTLSFQRYLRAYLPADGWALHYQINGGASPTDQPVAFESAADGVNHLIEIPAETTAAWLPGDFELVGYAVKAATNERHQIYRAEIVLQENAEDSGDAPTTTHAQRMIKLVEAQLERMAVHELDATTIAQAEVRRVQRKHLMEQLREYKEIRVNELNAERIRNGLPATNMVQPTFNICG